MKENKILPQQETTTAILVQIFQNDSDEYDIRYSILRETLKRQILELFDDYPEEGEVKIEKNAISVVYPTSKPIGFKMIFDMAVMICMLAEVIYRNEEDKKDLARVCTSVTIATLGEQSPLSKALALMAAKNLASLVQLRENAISVTSDSYEKVIEAEKIFNPDSINCFSKSRGKGFGSFYSCNILQAVYEKAIFHIQKPFDKKPF